jgi:hypothetical protein
MRRILVATLVVAVVATLSGPTTADPVSKSVGAAGGGQVPFTILVVLPGAPSPETAAAATKLINALVGEAPAGTRVVFFDGPARQRLAEADIPDGPLAARVRAVARPLGPVFQHLRKTGSVRAGAAADALDLPGFIPTVASLVRTARGNTRLVVVGSPYHSDTERGATFMRSQVPSVDHVLASSRQSPFGTSDLEKALDGVRVDWLLVDQSSARERSHVSSFWSAFFSTHLKATLCTFLDSPKDVAERAAANAADPVPAVRLTPSGKLQILGIDALEESGARAAAAGRGAKGEDKAEVAAATTPATATATATVPLAEPFQEPADETNPTGVPVSVLLVVDGSASMREPLKSAAGLCLEVAKLGAVLSPQFELGILVHRGTGHYSKWAASVERPDADGTPSDGMAALARFINEPSVDVEHLLEASGDRPGPKAGKQARVTPFEPVNTPVNVEDALSTALKVLGDFHSDRKVLVVVGDAGGSEFDSAEGVSDEDRRSELRALDAVRGFLRANPDARIISVFTGPRKEKRFTDNADATRFFKSLATTAGSHGTFTEDFAEMVDLTKRAMLNQ